MMEAMSEAQKALVARAVDCAEQNGIRLSPAEIAMLPTVLADHEERMSGRGTTTTD